MRASACFLLLAAILLGSSMLSLAETGDDQPPSWSSMPVLTAVEDVPMTIDLSGNLSDPDTPLANLTLSSSSPYVENITGLSVTFLFPNGVLNANVTLVARDANNSVQAIVQFTIEPVNDPPRWEPRLERLPDGELDTFYSFNLTATDEDDEVEDLAYASDAEFFSNSPTGEIAFIPSYEMTGPNWFNVTVYDPRGLHDTMELLLLIEPFPEWFVHYIPPQNAREGVVFTLNIRDYLVYNWDWLPPEDRLTFTYYDDTSKLDTNPETGEVVWDAPTNVDVGDHFFTITVVDSKGRADQIEIKISVPMPPPPGCFPIIGAQKLTQDVRYTLTMPLDPYYKEYPNINGGFTFSNHPKDLFIIDPDTGVIDLVPLNEQVGTWIVVIEVIFDSGLKESVQMVFIVQNVNDAPTIEHVFDLHLTEGEPFQLNLEGRDVDMDVRQDGTRLPVDLEERLMFSGGLDGGQLDPVTGVWEIVPDQGHVNASPMVVEFMVSDAGGLNYTVQVKLSVKDVVMEPSVIIAGVVEGQSLPTNSKVILGAVTVDESGEEWAGLFRWYEGTTLIGMDREIVWMPRRSGLVELSLVAEDEEGATARTTVVVYVKSASPPEPMVPPSSVVICIGSIIALVVVLNIYILLGRRKGR